MTKARKATDTRNKRNEDPQKPIPPILPKHILSLTSARFIASFAIVLYHFKDQMGFHIEEYTHILKNAYVGVDFFFILSGFIMAHSYVTQITQKKFSFLTFMKRRFARIYPVHFVTLMAFCGLGFLFFLLGIKPNIPEKYTLEAIPINLLLLQAWGLKAEGTFNTPSWSISAEWLAYLLFLPLILLLLKLNKILSLTLTIITMIAFYFITPSITGTQMTGLAHHLGILRIIPEFFYGIAMYLFLSYKIPSQKISTALWVGGLIAMLFCLHFGVLDLITIFLFGILIYALAARSCYGQHHILDNPVLIYGGQISYSMYMIHALIYTLAFNGADILLENQSSMMQIIIWGVSVIAVFPAAIVLFHLIEEPGRKFINKTRFFDKP